MIRSLPGSAFTAAFTAAVAWTEFFAESVADVEVRTQLDPGVNF
jgi:hypothetical protein